MTPENKLILSFDTACPRCGRYGTAAFGKANGATLVAQSARSNRSRWHCCADVAFSGTDGVFINGTSLTANKLRIHTQIMRHSSPDYQTQLASN